MARVRIYIGRHLCTAPRPQKEADALASAGHQVSVHGIAYRRDYAVRDAQLAAGRAWTWAPVADYSTSGQGLPWLLARFRHRWARRQFAQARRITPEVWGYGHGRIAAHARQQPADLTLVHAEGGLAVAEELLANGHRVGVDFEDWFSQDLAPGQREGRPVAELARLEARLLRATPYALTTSRALAQAMAESLQAPAPQVVYNTFAAGQPPPEPTSDPARPLRLHWFSLVIGPARGLEELFAALPRVRGAWELHLRGECAESYRQDLLGGLPAELAARVTFHPLVAAEQLPAALLDYDVGLALEVSAIPSRNLTITNKFFHYLQAGLAVVASDTAGHREGLELAGPAGLLFAAGQPADLARALNQLTADRALVLALRQQAARSFQARLAHEHQQGRYAELAARALAAPSPS